MESLGLEIVLFTLSVLAVLLSIIGLPGNFVPVAAALIATLAGDGRAFTWVWFAVFLAIAVSGEVVDWVTGVLGARKFGATRVGMMGAAVGGIAGAVFGSIIFPVIGSLIGVFAGCFVLTFLFEYIFSERPAHESGRAGVGAVLGKSLAAVYKIIVGFSLLVLMAWRFWFLN